MTSTPENMVFPGAPSCVLHKVEHCRQRYDWDCGVSCVMMLLPGDEREKFLNTFTQICTEEGFGQSTWTIDLCYLLKRFNIDHCMYTIRMGVNEDYKKKRYYDKIIDQDRSRVTERFAAAAGAGIRCCERTVTVAGLLAHLGSRGPALLLVDHALLRCRSCVRPLSRLYAELRRCLGGGEFTGHYILLVGYEGYEGYGGGGGRVLYRDPARGERGGRGGALCSISLAHLQRARTAVGTDHDVILIYRDYR